MTFYITDEWYWNECQPDDVSNNRKEHGVQSYNLNLHTKIPFHSDPEVDQQYCPQRRVVFKALRFVMKKILSQQRSTPTSETFEDVKKTIRVNTAAQKTGSFVHFEEVQVDAAQIKNNVPVVADEEPKPGQRKCFPGTVPEIQTFHLVIAFGEFGFWWLLFRARWRRWAGRRGWGRSARRSDWRRRIAITLFGHDVGCRSQKQKQHDLLTICHID